MKSKKYGIAFLKGVSMFGRKNISEDSMRKLLKRIEKKHPNQVKFIGVYGIHSDIVVFQKSGVHYATVGHWIEDEIKKDLGLDVPVTTRSLKTVKLVVDRF